MPCVTKPCSVVVIVVSSNRSATWLPKHHGVTTVAVRPRTVPTGTQTTAWNIRHHGELFVRLLTLSSICVGNVNFCFTWFLFTWFCWTMNKLPFPRKRKGSKDYQEKQIWKSLREGEKILVNIIFKLINPSGSLLRFLLHPVCLTPFSALRFARDYFPPSILIPQHVPNLRELSSKASA